MRLEGNRQSSNVDDRRGGGRRMAAVAGVPVGCGTLVLGVIFVALGGDPRIVLQLLSEVPPPQAPTTRAPAADPNDAQGVFVRTILADTEDVWGTLFAEAGQRYPQPTLVLFEGEVRSACGFNSAATGPFYCPGDQKVYIDLSFYRLLRERFRAPGDFAAAYVLAHEVGHHVQHVTGTMDQVQAQQQRSSRADANALSVKLELQADCYAGVWAHHAHAQRQLLEAGDVEEGLRAAAAIGDDNIQSMSGQRISPESWTHGSSQQRVEWFRTGLQHGAISRCDTFR